MIHLFNLSDTTEKSPAISTLLFAFNVPAITVLPVDDSTVNLLDATEKS